MSRVKISFDPTFLRRLRDEEGLSIEQAAEQLGLEPHVVSGLEKGTRALTKRQARILEARLKVLSKGRHIPLPGASRPPMPGSSGG